MPVVLSQHFLSSDRIYNDAEGSLYHYPRVYFSRVRPYEPFVYYRPLGDSTPRHDSSTYFGHRVLGEWYEDWRDPRYRYANILRYAPFRQLVPLRDPFGNYYESATAVRPQFQSAVRDISVTAYHRILAAAAVTQRDIDAMPDTERIAASAYPLPIAAAPRDEFRRIDEIPAGAGYVPRSDPGAINVYEAAALQERARRDHQRALQVIQRAVLRLGGTTLYNNNVDLLARVGERAFLIEAKSVTSPAAAIDRMRYGVGQLADYAYRYEETVGGARRVLAFADPPGAENAWIAGVLEHERIAFVAARGEDVLALNQAAHDLPFVER